VAIAGSGLLWRQAEPRHHAGPESLDHDVRAIDQLARNNDVRRVMKVENDRTFASLEQGVHRVMPARAAGRIHADDIRPVLGEQKRDERARQILTEINNAKPVEHAHADGRHRATRRL
jgi:hypothetical protein